MAYTDPNTYFHTTAASNNAFAKDLVMALCGVHPTIPSTTRYTVVESYHSVSAVRQVPTSNLLENSTNGWEPGGATPGSNSWIVLQCEETRSGNYWHGMIWITGNIEIRLFPLGDWVPGGGVSTNPTRPATELSDTNPGLALAAGTNHRSMVWDKSMWCVLGYDYPTGTSVQKFNYMGEFDSWLDPALDTRPFCMYGSSSSSDNWQRKSASNNTSQTALAPASMATNRTLSYGPVQMIPYILEGTQASHQQAAGVARHCAFTGAIIAAGPYRALSHYGTTDRAWVQASTTGGGSFICVRHDGTDVSNDAELARVSYDLEPPTGYPLIRTRPWLVRGRP